MDFWLKKLESNVIRDIHVKSDLELLGWRVIIVWQCELRDLSLLSRRIVTTLADKNIIS